MQAIKCGLPPGLVGVISGDLSRYPSFMVSMMNLMVPKDSSWKWVRGNGIAANRNLILRGLQPEHEWVWFIDDDHSFEPEILLKMLSRNVDLLQPLISTRKPPFQPYAYMWSDSGVRSLSWEEIKPNELNPVDAIGCGGALIRRIVLDKIGKPWFEEGKLFADCIGEDLYLCKKAERHGFQCYVDASVTMGHMTTAEVWPVANQGMWCVDLDLYHGVRIRVDANIGNKALAEED